MTEPLPQRECWCGRPLIGKQERFCCNSHKTVFWSAGRKYVDARVQAGLVTDREIVEKYGPDLPCTADTEGLRDGG